MRAELGLPSVKGDDEHGGGMTGGFGGSMGGAQGGKGKRPISVKFEIPYFTTSGIQVRYLKIIEPKVCKPAIFLEIPPHWRIEPFFSCNEAAIGSWRFWVCPKTKSWVPQGLDPNLQKSLNRAFPGYAPCMWAYPDHGVRWSNPSGDLVDLPRRGNNTNNNRFVRWMMLHDVLTHVFRRQLQYPSLPWVRYITQSGDIAVRLPDVQ